MRIQLNDLALWRLILAIFLFLHYHFECFLTPNSLLGYVVFVFAIAYSGLLYFSVKMRLKLRKVSVLIDLILVGCADSIGQRGYLFFLYYLPIIAVAKRDGLKDALISAVIASSVFCGLHLFAGAFQLISIMQIMSFLVVGLFTGMVLESKSATFRADLPVDNLTGLPTRTTFNDVVGSLIARDNLKEYAVILLDIDEFRSFNENHGYTSGNQVLIMIAQAILRQIRSNDVAARYDSEEYVIFLPDVTKEGAVQIAERLREMLESIMVSRGLPDIKISFGIAEAPTDGDDVFGLISSARHRMYLAKDLGGNRVVASLTE